MAVSRRTTLKGMGVLLGAGGMEALRSTATNVDTSQGVTVEFVPDDGANVQIEPARDFSGIEYDETVDGAVTVTLSNINRSARTRFEGIFAFTNNGVNTVTGIEATVTGVSGNGEITASGGLDSSIDPGDSEDGLSIVINTTDADGFTGEPDIEASVSLRVETDA